jgi:hypothetical protein
VRYYGKLDVVVASIFILVAFEPPRGVRCCSRDCKNDSIRQTPEIAISPSSRSMRPPDTQRPMARQLISWSIEVPNGDWEGRDWNDDEQQTLRESCQARWALPRRFVRTCGPSASHTEPLTRLRFLAMGKRKAISRTKPSAWLKRVLTRPGGIRSRSSSISYMGRHARLRPT